MSWENILKINLSKSEVAEYRRRIKDVDFEALMDLVYLIARGRMNLSLTDEHRNLIDQLEPIMIEQAISPAFHEEQIKSAIYERDKDTDERDDKWYATDRLHG